MLADVQRSVVDVDWDEDKGGKDDGGDVSDGVLNVS